MTAQTNKRILITGAAGQIGDAVRKGLRGSYPLIRVADIAPLGEAESGEEIHAADIRDIAAMEKVMVGIDCVVHFAGQPEEGEWDKVLSLNIEGCYNVFEAARRQGVKRIIFASSNHAIGFHRRERFIDNTAAPRPDFTLRRLEGVRRGARPPLCGQTRYERCMPPDRGLSKARQAGGPPAIAGMDQSSRHGAAYASLH